jgi:hypothetical protein
MGTAKSVKKFVQPLAPYESHSCSHCNDSYDEPTTDGPGDDMEDHACPGAVTSLFSSVEPTSQTAAAAYKPIFGANPLLRQSTLRCLTTGPSILKLLQGNRLSDITDRWVVGGPLTVAPNRPLAEKPTASSWPMSSLSIPQEGKKELTANHEFFLNFLQFFVFSLDLRRNLWYFTLSLHQ